MRAPGWTRLVHIPGLFAWGRSLNLGLKLLLVVLLVAGALLEGTLPQLEGKGMVPRALTFWMAAAAVPVMWLALGRPGGRYPHVPDGLLVMPAAADIVSNFAGLFERFAWWDPVAHFGAWLLLCLAFATLLLCLPIHRANLAALVVGFGSFTHILWELGEWVAQELVGVAWLHLTHRDTMLDFLFGLIGTFTAAVIAVYVLWPRVSAERRARGRPARQFALGPREICKSSPHAVDRQWRL